VGCQLVTLEKETVDWSSDYSSAAAGGFCNGGLQQDGQLMSAVLDLLLLGSIYQWSGWPLLRNFGGGGCVRQTYVSA
jgi:hypothetical protein